MSKNRRFCPNCGSTSVEPDTSNRAEIFFSGGNPNKWQCDDCGYTGLMPHHSPEENECSEQQSGGMLRPEGDPEKDFDPETDRELEFEPDEEYPRSDTGFGKGYLKYLLYVTLPALVIYILYQLLI